MGSFLNHHPSPMPPSNQPPADRLTTYLPPEFLHLAEKIIRKYSRNYPSSLHNEIRSAGLFGLNKAISRFDPARDLSRAFVVTCVRNTILDVIRKENFRAGKTDSRDLSEVYAPGSIPPADQMLDIKRVLEMVRTLSHERSVMELALEGHTREEIGKRLGLKKNTVTTRYHRGILKLRRMLSIDSEAEAA